MSTTPRTKLQEKIIKDTFNIRITHVNTIPVLDDKGKQTKDKDGNPVYANGILDSFVLRYKAPTDVQAYTLALRDAQMHNGTLDIQSMDPSNPITAIIRFPDGSFAYIANELSDTQCGTCGAPENVYNDFCPECQARKAEHAKRGTGSKLDALMEALKAKDTRRGRN